MEPKRSLSLSEKIAAGAVIVGLTIIALTPFFFPLREPGAELPVESIRRSFACGLILLFGGVLMAALSKSPGEEKQEKKG
jgi:hypothetical protein